MLKKIPQNNKYMGKKRKWHNKHHSEFEYWKSKRLSKGLKTVTNHCRELCRLKIQNFVYLYSSLIPFKRLQAYSKHDNKIQSWDFRNLDQANNMTENCFLLKKLCNNSKKSRESSKRYPLLLHFNIKAAINID